MATTIVTKSGSGAPTASDLVAGELAVDLTNKRLYTEDSGGTVLEVGSNPYNFTANHDGSAKLATTATGIDVTGTVTADGLTVQTTNGLNALLESSNSYQYLQFKNTDETNNYIGFVSDDFVVSPANNQKLIVTAEGNVGIGTSSPSTYDSRANNLVVGDSGDAGVTIFSGATSVARLVFAASGDTGLANGVIGYDNNNDSLAFEVAGSERMRISSTGKVGIGMDPDTNNVLSVKNTSGKVINLTNGVNADLYVDLTSGLTLVSPSTGTLAFGTSSTERMRIDASGNLGIGTSSPTANTILHMKDTDTQIELESTNGSNSAFIDFDGTNLQLSTNRNMVDGSFSNTGKSAAGIFMNGPSGGSHIVLSTASANNTTPTERMRIDSSGHVIVKNGGRFYLESSSGFSPFLSESSNDLLFTVNNGERMRIDASGFVGIKTTPNAWKTAWSVLDIGVSGSLFAQDNNTTGLSNNLYFTGSDWVHKNTGQTVLYQQSEGLHLFYSNASQAAGATFSPTERMRIDASGNLLVGTTTPVTKLTVSGQGAFGSADASGNGIYLYVSGALSDNSYMSRNSAGSGTTTWYIGNQSITTSSDLRLKDNIVDSQRNAVEIINNLRVVDHTWNDPSDQSINNKNSRGVWTGLIAQEAVEHIPWLVNRPLEDVDENGNKNYWHMDYGYSVPLLIKAIQEQQATIEALTARIAALES
jgi:hypothetical protein